MSFLSQPLQFFSIGPTRSFGGVSGYVTIQENTTDKIQITKQPVQQGANISDHAFKEPVSISIQMSFRDNSGVSLSDIYKELLDLQVSFVPFDVVTPKRTYSNMLFGTLSQTTDKKTENCLAINATFEEVIIVNVSAVVVVRSNLKNPGNNGATQKAGRKSALKVLAEGIGQAFRSPTQ